ncbi:flavodoxin family protein [Methanosphaerula palustris]|uniref:NADPH-dependent FMN reductase n=1 Tax=Methanosphaerula palustris (strain ATCC BAA-1556 / DSM 19958 / E1-9c) TaxID=521011 RepID=B8GFJ1_METPE|nr:flavodoxin family protein [Methanosphaerula palustris]ACL16039.1 NADPH-dependent FMN reductase [Methanosphaerula palustris E1-9c]
MDTWNTDQTHQPSSSKPGERTKVIAINSSPRKERGNTALILNPLLTGMKEAGADVDLYYTEDLSVLPCRGDLTCFCRPSGRCIQSDDMEWLMPEIREADILVFASPLYVDGVNGPMKTLIDRLVPLLHMSIETRDGHSRHTPKDTKVRRIMLVSNCGFWERDNFDPLIMHMQALSKNMNAEFAGALIRPHGTFMRSAAALGLPFEDILEAAGKAGHQIVEDGIIAEETLATVSREMLSYEQFIQISTPMIESLTAKLGREDRS